MDKYVIFSNLNKSYFIVVQTLYMVSALLTKILREHILFLFSAIEELLVNFKQLKPNGAFSLTIRELK